MKVIIFWHFHMSCAPTMSTSWQNHEAVTQQGNWFWEERYLCQCCQSSELPYRLCLSTISINQHYCKQLLLHFQQALKLVAKHRWKLHTYVYICIRMYVFSVYLYRYIYEYCLNPTMLSNNSKISVLSFTQLNSQHRTVNTGHWA